MKCIKLYITHILNVSQYSSHQTIFLRKNDTLNQQYSEITDNELTRFHCNN